jgi:hypothetical protein
MAGAGMMPPFAVISPTFGPALMGVVGGLFFGGLLALILIVVLQKPLTRRAITPGVAGTIGFLASGAAAALCVTICFSVLWTTSLGAAGWRTHLDDCVAVCSFACAVAVLPASVFGALFYYASHSPVNSAAP